MHSYSDATLFWIGLSRIPGVGRITFRKLIKQCGSAEQALSETPQNLRRISGLSEKVINSITGFPWREEAGQELARAEQAGVAIILVDDPSFPERLRSTPDPPLFLYVRGTLIPRDMQAIAVVGTRTPTHTGVTATHRMAYELAAAGTTIVSGMARGIDTQAHKGALAANGRTIAVLGCGIDVAYPPENKSLMESISGSGAVITENPLGTKPESGYFPARNRIISGLSAGTVIIEAAEDSGSLITADYALEQGRTLFAMPGSVSSPTSRGTNALIKRGALLVENAADVLRGLKLECGKASAPSITPQPAMSSDEEFVFRILSAEPRHIDTITAEARIAPGKAGGILITLELKGLVKQLPGKYFVREDL